MSEQRRPTPERRSSLANMSAARWTRVQDVFAAAVECATAERDALLDRECADDPDLRREVESLLTGHERSGLMDGLAEALSAPVRWRSRIDAMEWRGRRVAQYSIVEQLGAGGMGFVYKAHDERLNRFVALKFLPPHLGARADAKQRFLVEARAAAQLDHPNICTIHEIGETPDGQLFIAMPLYEGETLEDRLGAVAAARLRGGRRDCAADRIGPREGARTRRRASRREALQRHAASRRRREDSGFRRRARSRRLTGDARRRRARHGRLHEPRAGARRARRCENGHLVARRRALRNAGRRAAVSR